MKKHEAKQKKKQKKNNKEVNYQHEIQNVSKSSSKSIRNLYPYHYTYRTYTKSRWINKTILEVYTNEFKNTYSDLYYKYAISEGLITINDDKVSVDYKLQHGDCINHTVHRHEPPILHNDIPELYEDDAILVVNKPCTVPLHPCGSYHFNTLFHLLQNDTRDKLHTIHRLDRLTSGITIIGKNKYIAQTLTDCFTIKKDDDSYYTNHSKVYLARVNGKFPLNAPSTAMMDYDIGKNTQFGEYNNEIAFGFWFTNQHNQPYNDMLQHLANQTSSINDVLSCNQDKQNKITWLHFASPTHIIDPKNGIGITGPPSTLPQAKPAQTKFTPLHYDTKTNTSILAIIPSTGRTHQIRLHLQYLNHSISNDPNYGGDLTFGYDEHELRDYNNACSLLQKINENVHTEYDEDYYIKREDESVDEYRIRTCKWCNQCKNINTSDTNEETTQKSELSASSEKCNTILNKVIHKNKLEFMTRSHGIWLHALQYNFFTDYKKGGLTGGDKEWISFRTDLPDWCSAFIDLKSFTL